MPVKNTTKLQKDDWARGLGPLLTFWKKLNKGQDWLRISVPKIKNESTILATYMSEEYRFSIELIQHIHRNFSSINKIIRGAALATEKDVEIVTSLLAYQVLHY